MFWQIVVLTCVVLTIGGTLLYLWDTFWQKR